MKYPNWVQNEFVDQNALNNAFGLASGAIAGTTQVIMSPGIYRPDVVGFTVSGLTLNSTLPLPFSVIFGTGDYVQAHGLVTNTDTQSYSTSFSGVVPGSGSVTAYLIASLAAIQQSPYQVVGPPPGHPDYNPTFVPFTAYAQNVDTLLLQASTTAPDNSATFEICRFTINSGASALGTPNTTFQNRASAVTTLQGIVASGNYTVPISGSSEVYIATAALTFTLPPLSGSSENWYGFTNQVSGAVNVQVQGTDSIWGTIGNPTSGITIMPVPQNAYIQIGAVNGIWQVTASSLFGFTASGVTYVTNAVSGFVKFAGATAQPILTFAGVSGTANLNMASGGNVPTVTVSGGVPSSGFNPGITGALYIN